MTKLCVPILVDDPAQALADAREARDRGADLVEFRLDGYYTGAHEVAEAQFAALEDLVKRAPLPCIVTCRPVLEGGHYDGPETARIEMLVALARSASPAYVDVEGAIYLRSAAIKARVDEGVDHPGQQDAAASSLILSAHDFHTRPPDLIRRVENMLNEPAAHVVKVAYRARSLRDNLELLDILAEVRGGKGLVGKPMIALALGPFGLMSRVLAPKFDAFLTFASLRRSSATAPGQPIISELVDLYRFRSINSATRVYGVIGYPVEQSLSPLVQNAGFEAIGHDGVYLPLPIPPEYEHLKATLPALIDHVHLDFAGCSVTTPHKANLVRLAQELYEDGDGRWQVDALCARCGAANSVTVERDPRGNAQRILVSNTDADAALAVLDEALKPGAISDATPGSVVILGAGGTARAVATRLLEHGVPIVLVNRTRAHAEELADLLRPLTPSDPARICVASAAEIAALAPAVILNCTPVGMQGGGAPDASLLDVATLGALPNRTVIADCVYNPLRTPLLIAAEAAGLRTIDGAAMFVRQAAAQFELWTKSPAPRGLFDRVVRETLQMH